MLDDQSCSFVLTQPEAVEKIELLPRLSVGADFELTVTHSDGENSFYERVFESVGPTDALDDGHRLDLIPANHLESSAPGEFTSTDIDPQFLIEGLAEAPVQGWTVMRITMTTDEPVVPTFYLWSGSDITEIRLPIFKGSADRLLLVRLPDQVDRMRFDPTDRADVVISNVGLSVRSFAHAPPVAFMPVKTHPRGRQNPNQAHSRPGHASSMLRISRDVVATESGYRVSGPQPTLMFVAGEGAPPSGIWRLTLRGRSASGPLTTELVVRATDGAVRSHYDLPEMVGDQARRLVLNLPDSIEDIELCPRLSVGDEFDLTVTQSDDAESLSERLFEPAGPTDRLHNGYRLDLIPANHLESSAPGDFTSTDIDPQFLIAGLAEAPVRGWTVLRLTMATDEPVRPTLYVWSEGEVTEIPLPIVNGRADKLFLLRLPAQVDIMRFDPTDRADVVMSGVGLSVQSFAHAPPAAFMPVENDLRRIQYDSWVSLYDQISAEDEVIIRHRISVIPDKPLISVLMPVYNPEPRFLVKAIESVRSQIYENWELCIADDASTNPEINRILGDYRSRDPRIKVIFRSENGHISASSNSALEMVSGEFVGLMDHDDELPRHALYMVAVELTSSPDIDIIYTDEDKVDSQGRRHDPYFKSSWSLDLFYSQNFVAHFGVYRTSLIRMIGGFRVGFEGSQDYDLVLRLLPLTRPERIRHIPHVLYHWRIYEGVSTFSTDNPGRSLDSARRALVEHFERAGDSVEVVELPNFPSWWRIVRPAPLPEPLVTIIIPTRDRVELVKNCIESIKRHTKYSNYEIIVVDNASVEESTLEYFFSLKYRRIAKIIRVDEPFNYSRLNNLAAAEANGDLLLLLNNDVVVITPDWLTELVTQVLRKGVGAVGAKLRYQNDSLQHAGVTLGLNGAAGHGHRHFPHDSIGYFGWPQLQRDVSAVTAAALIVRKDVFYEVGGLDELNLIVSYNDVDLCLKIREHGYRIIYDPFVDLYHLESVSRGADITRAQKDLQRREREFLVGRWGDSLARDPFYSPNLSLDSEDFQIAFPPRAEKPWRRSPASMDVIAAEQQRRFKLTAQVSPYALQAVALETVVVIANEAPYSTLSAFAAHLKGEKLLPARVVIVDSDVAGESHTGRAVIEAWRAAFPTAPVDVVAQGGANLDIGEQVRSGLASVMAAAHVVVIAEECSSFAPHSFEFLLRSYVHLGCEAAICGIAIDPDSRVEVVADPAGVRLRSDEPVDLFGLYESLPAPTYVAINELLGWDPVAPTDVVNSGLFMGRSEWFLAEDDTSGISYKTIQGVLADISRRLEGGGHRMASASTCLVSLRRARSRDLPVAWKHFYDFIWLNRSASGVAPPDVIEFVCPFHRGDVIIGLQVANALVQTGKALRFHVAAGLLSWAGDFEPEFELVGLDLEVPSAERTSLEFWRGLIQVIARSDSSPSIVLSHPERSLDELRKNLVGSMMEAAGLQPFDMLEPMAPKPSLQQVTAGQEALEAFAGPLVLLHASGGWELKTIPDDLVSRLVALAHEEGYKVVQIGGPTDPPIEACDGHILAALNPGEWSVLFRGAKALMGVDSWSAHLAEILDLPQLTLYGSTQPEHVSSHGYFPSSSSKLVFPPQVDCSPCNSTVCLINGTQRCDGYWIDVAKARAFFRALAVSAVRPAKETFANAKLVPVS
jgi:GT2 family glycosyltransferase